MDNSQQTFENLVHAYSAELYRFAFWQCKNKSLAEDMLQECFSRAWKALHKLEDEKKAKAWLYTILRREIARHFGRNTHDTVSLDEIDIEQLGAHYDCTVSDDINLRQALDKLPHDYRDALMLQVLGGYSCEEIAQLSGVKTGTIMTRVFRARQKLRQLLTTRLQSSANLQ
ncbi:sigma-70 family RNA polymerase sigma factor [Beggiatoa alba]|nr:sigma-70 family RNA polymerase sigma factor [Beggiatoa alba]